MKIIRKILVLRQRLFYSRWSTLFLIIFLFFYLTIDAMIGIIMI
jgi:hypothetical protein